MKGQRMTPKEYELWLQAFRECGENWSRVARWIQKRVPGREATTAQVVKRGYQKGWPNHDGDFPPIFEVLAAETAKAEAEIAKKTRLAIVEDAIAGDADAIALAHDYQVQAKAEEGILVGKARKNLLEVMDSSKNLLTGINRLSASVGKHLERMEIDSDDPEGATNAVQLLWRASTALRAATAATKDVLECERLVMNRPTTVVEHRVGASATTEETLRHIQKNYENSIRMQERIARRERLEAELEEKHKKTYIDVEVLDTGKLEESE